MKRFPFPIRSRQRAVITGLLCSAAVVVCSLPNAPIIATSIAQVSTIPLVSAGSIYGDFEVSPIGEATYRIPLAVAPGRQGMQPHLALTYRSNGDNGHLGVGWSLEGLSQIARCGSNPARDGVRRALNWDAQDNLCIDGEKLLLLSGNAQVDGAVYATDRESFRKIVGVGTPHTGFRVFLPDGRISTYGTTSECGSPCTATVPVHAPPNDLTLAIRAWNLSTVTDRHGNWMRINWGRRAPSSDPAIADGSAALGYTAEDFPLSIQYTGHNGTPVLAPQRTVSFTYTERSDDDAGYTRGVHSMRTKRLSKITSSVAGLGVFREYKLNYHASAVSARSLLSSVTECGGDGYCHPPTMFNWQETPRVFGANVREETPIVAGDGKPLQSRRKLGAGLMLLDINGDGRDDLVYVKGTTDTNRTWRIALAYPAAGAVLNGGAPSLPACSVTSGTYRCEINTGIAAPVDLSAQALDYNGDGRDDLLLVDNRSGQTMTTWKVLQSNGNGFDIVNTWVTDHPFTDGASYDISKRVHIADVNGDSRPDLLVCEPRLTGSGAPPWHLRLHDGGGWGSEKLLPFFTNAPQDCRRNTLMFVDVDGDGATEVLAGGYDALYFAANFMGPAITMAPTTLRTIINGFWQGNGVTFFTDSRSIDVNGDGLLDIVADRDLPQSDGTLDVFLNTGAGFAPSGGDGFEGLSDQGREPTLGQSARLDYDGDGRDDMLITNACPSGSVLATCAAPRWMILDATSNAPQLGAAQAPLFARRELAGCTNGTTGCIAHRTGPSATESWFGYQQARIGDVNGDQLPDLVLVENDKVIVHRNQGLPGSDRIVEIRDGLAWPSIPSVRIEYKPTTDGTVLTTPAVDCAFPLDCTRPGGYLVSAHYADSGVGSTVQEFRYTYSEPRRDVLGGGFLGYRINRMVRVANGATSTTTYHPAEADDLGGGRRWYPLTRLPLRTESTLALGGGRYQSAVVDRSYKVTSFNNGRTHFVRANGSVATTREGTSATFSANPVLTQVTKQISLDGFGNPLSTTTTNGVSTLRNSSSYLNDVDAWILGQETRTTVSSTVNGETQTRVTRRRFDPATGRAVGVDVESPAIATSTIAYDSVGNVTSLSETDVSAGDTRTTLSSYDTDPERQFVMRVTNALGHSSTYEYNRLLGLATKATSPNGVSAVAAHDSFGRTRAQLRADGSGALYRYDLVDDGAGRSHVETLTRYNGGSTLNAVLDRKGRTIRHERVTAEGDLAIVDQAYDALGNLVARNIPHLQGTSAAVENWTYDGASRVTSHRRADGSTSSMRYTGLSLQFTDPRGNTTTSILDAEAQPQRVTDAMGGVTTYSYGPFGSLRKVTDPVGNVTTTNIDNRGHVLSISDPDTGDRYYDYDAFGRRTQEKDALGRTIMYKYDALNRRVSRIDGDGTTEFTYDTALHGIGALAKATSPAGHAESYAYDSAGRIGAIVTTAAGDSVVQKFGYDDDGRLEATMLSANNAESFSLVYDYASDGTLRKIAEKKDLPALYEVTARNARGQVVEETFRGGAKTNYTIDVRNGRKTRIETISPVQAAPLQSLSYRYDDSGNIIERTDNLSGVRESLSYDDLDRLERSSVCRPACTDRQMKYDAIGNIRAKWDIGEYLYDGKPHAVTKAGGVTYAYDAVGNQIRRDSEVRKFNALNKLAVVQAPNAAASQFEYDAFGRRVRETSTTSSAFRVADRFERARRNGILTDRFTVKASGRSVAVISRSQGQQDLRYIHPDVLGSADLITDSDGKLVSRPLFDVFGRAVKGDWGGPPIALGEESRDDGYTGHHHESASELINMVGREYDPALARFLQADPYVQSPFQSQSFNRYSYVFNNPLRYVDPSGYEGESSSVEFDPVLVEGDLWATDVVFDDVLVEGDIWGNEDTGEGEGEGDYDDSDDGDQDDDYDGPGEDDTGFDDRDAPSDPFDGIGTGVEDAIEALDSAGNGLARKAQDDPTVDDEDAWNMIVIMAMGVGVAGAAAVAVGVAGALKVGEGAAIGLLGAGAATVPAPVDLPPLQPAGPPQPPTVPDPPPTFQAHHGMNLAQDNFGKALTHISPDPFKFDVVIHGGPNGFTLPDGTPITPQQLAQMILNDFNYNGEAIRLFSCDAGKDISGAAAQLSQALGVDVYAAAQPIDLYANGTMGVTGGTVAVPPSEFQWIPFIAP